MVEVEDVHYHCKAFPRGYYKGRDVLLEELDHLVDYQLAHCVQNREQKDVCLDLLVRSEEVKDIHQLEAYGSISEGYNCGRSVDVVVHLDCTRLEFGFDLGLQVG
jgi:hypothetical protein